MHQGFVIQQNAPSRRLEIVEFTSLHGNHKRDHRQGRYQESQRQYNE
jgi:hypothetical protein